MSEYIIEIPAYVPPFDPLVRAASLGEEVVRCRDCRYYAPKEGAMLSCKFEYHGFTQWKLAEPNGFCAWGKRRDA